jgi:hypothetical protein
VSLVCTRNCSINAALAALNFHPSLKRRALLYALVFSSTLKC